jgi:hypothetical protein
MTTRRAIRDYHEPAGGWGALKAVAVALTEQDSHQGQREPAEDESTAGLRLSRVRLA